MGRTSKRDIVLDTAEALFSTQGFTATGINQVTKEAGVASMTLYNNFANKDALVVATLKRRSDVVLRGIHEAVERAGDDPRLRIEAVFNAVEDWIRKEQGRPSGFPGCMFLRAAQEYPAASTTARTVAIEHKRHIIDLFKIELIKLDCQDPEDTAMSLHLLIDGGITQAQLFCDMSSIARSRNFARLLLL
jgi:AcrR family transcriptional regulator